jgi:hypothetical protein
MMTYKPGPELRHNNFVTCGVSIRKVPLSTVSITLASTRVYGEDPLVLFRIFRRSVFKHRLLGFPEPTIVKTTATRRNGH